MSNEIVIQVDNPNGWGDRAEIAAVGRRLKALLPGGEKFSDNQAMALAQYAQVTDSNPFRGEVYGYESRGKFVIVEGYKLLVRWAKRQCDFTEKYTELTPEERKAHGVAEDTIAVKCHILRDDKKADIKLFLECGATFQEALAQVMVTAVGTLSKKEMAALVDPPKSWTWLQVAEKRALKNALNRAYGMPSPKEIQRDLDESSPSKGMTRQERIDLLRGEEEKGIE